MPETTTTVTPQGRHEDLVEASAETTEPGNVRDRGNEKVPRLRSPKEFYAVLTQRADVRDFLQRLADR